jgi:hypothetical protein
MVGLVVAIVILVLFEVVAVRFGVDSRDGRDWACRHSG